MAELRQWHAAHVCCPVPVTALPCTCGLTAPCQAHPWPQSGITWIGDPPGGWYTATSAAAPGRTGLGYSSQTFAASACAAPVPSAQIFTVNTG